MFKCIASPHLNIAFSRVWIRIRMSRPKTWYYKLMTVTFHQNTNSPEIMNTIASIGIHTLSIISFIEMNEPTFTNRIWLYRNHSFPSFLAISIDFNKIYNFSLNLLRNTLESFISWYSSPIQLHFILHIRPIKINVSNRSTWLSFPSFRRILNSIKSTMTSACVALRWNTPASWYKCPKIKDVEQ